jgi:nucleotide-binding universal stress UspA family protein
MTDPSSGSHRIVVAVDGSEGARSALRWAIDQAERLGARHEPVHVWRDPPTVGIPVMPVIPPSDRREAAEAMLEEEVAKMLAERPTGVAIEPTVLEGPPGLRLVETASTADLLVVGARGFGVAAAFGLGSVSQQCVHHTTVPVAIVRADVAIGRTKGRVVVGVDGSEHSSRALAWAIAEARRRRAVLEVVMAWSLVDQPVAADAGRTLDQDAAEQVLDEILDRQPDAIDDVELVRTVVCDHPGTALVYAAHAADVVVVGTRGLGGLKRPALGSVSHHVAQQAASPVVIVP